jgi:hypothetical protein
MNSMPEHPVGVIQDLTVLDGGVHAHGNEVFLVGRGGDGLDAGGAERMRCSTISISAVYWLSIIPENIPAPFGQEWRAGQRLRPGWSSG